MPKVVPGEDRVLAGASIRFNELMDDLRDRKVRVALFIVDACRDNPFRDGSGRSVGGTRGLARIEPAEGSFVMYSAGAGEQALDRLPGADASPNSVYTRTLLPILAAPGLSLQDIAIRVRRQVVEVARSAGRKQTPAYYDQLVGNFVLKAGAAADAKPAVVPTPSGAAETARICREVEGMSNPMTLQVLWRQHRGTPAGQCVVMRLGQLKSVLTNEQMDALTAAVATPPPPKMAEPVLDGDNPFPKRTPGRTFRDCPECPEMVVMPAGSFMMGSPAGEAGRESDEGPQRQVTIARPFAVGKFEVTFAEWDACVTAGGCRHRPYDQGWGRGRRPVINVSWDDITKEYLPWLSRKTGKAYRLLTEAEWEYTVRAGTTTKYAFGDTISKSQAQFSEGSWGSAGKTVAVGWFKANAFGLNDMHGNVWEWVQDCWNGSYSGAPSDGPAWTTGDCGRRVLRGGSWNDNPQGLRSAVRNGITSGYRSSLNGFRVGRTL